MSPVGNNDVPYPYLIGTMNTYILRGGVEAFIPTDLLSAEQLFGTTSDRSLIYEHYWDADLPWTSLLDQKDFDSIILLNSETEN